MILPRAIVEQFEALAPRTGPIVHFKIDAAFWERLKLEPWQRELIRAVAKFKAIRNRIDAGGWPTRDAAAPEEDG